MTAARFVLALLPALISPLADFSGTYLGDDEGDKVELTLQQSGSTLTGEATYEGQKVTFKGTVSGDSAKGSVSFSGMTIGYFRMSKSGDKLVVKIADGETEASAEWSDATEITFQKRGGSATEKGSSRPEGAPTFSKTKSDVLKNGKTYEHASGGKLRYPSDWKLTEMEEGIELAPPQPQGGERYFVLAESAEGQTNPASREIGDYLDSQVQTYFPGMRRKGSVEKANAGGGPGAIYTWEGDIEGKKANVRAYVTILKNYGVSLVAVAPPEMLAQRDKLLREIFMTFGWGQGKVNASLVGTWQYFTYSQVSGASTTAKATLRADGTFSYQSDSERSSNLSGKDSGGNDLWSGGVYSRSGSGWGGTWTASGNELRLNFEDGSCEVFTYEIVQQGTATVLKVYGDDRKKAMEWSKIG